MDWDGSLIRSSFVNSRPDNSSNASSSFSSFLFNCSLHQLPGNYIEAKHHHPFETVPESSQAASGSGAENCKSSCYEERKKKLTSEQVDSLERSFNEEIKLEPERKMKLSRELGLQPRQIAVWFQNRRARWKAKHLERLYDALKQEFDAISREKLSLQEEVLRLKSMIRDEAATKKSVVSYTTKLSGEEIVESTCINRRPREVATAHRHQYGGPTINEYNNTISAAPIYWGSIAPSMYNNTTNFQ